MSQRTYIVGFEKAKLDSLFGSKDQKAIGELQKKIKADFDEQFDDSQKQQDALEMISQFINGSLNLIELELTSPLFTELIRNYLVFYNQDILWTNMENSGFYGYLNDIMFFVKDEEMKDLFEELYGSTLFSENNTPKYIDTPYAYISKDKVKKMARCINKDKDLFRPFSDDGKPFVEGIQMISDKELDLFLYTS